jgi:heptosyltransferase-3
MARQIELKRGDRILIRCIDRLSNSVLAIPLIETMKMRYPENSLDVLTSDYVAPILRNMKYIDKAVTVDNDRLQKEKEYQTEFLQRIKESNYHTALVLFPDKIISRLLYEAGIPYRIGTGRRFHSIYFNYHIFHSRKANKKHESEYNLDFIRFFRQGVLFKIPKLDLKIRELDEARKLLTLDRIKDNFLILHPGSGGSSRQWPLDQFIELYDLLTKKGLTVLMTGSNEEGLRIKKAAENYGVKVNSFAGKTDLLTLAALLSLAGVVVANSTGPLHLAAAVGTKVVGIYPSEHAISPVRWGPLGEGHLIVQPYKGSAIETITVEEVAIAVLNSVQKVEAKK